MADDRLSVRLPPALRKQLEDVAASRKKRPSEIIREALTAYLGRRTNGKPRRKKETAYDIALRIGLIGAAAGEDWPSDLSTNKAHMEGFGEE